ncbi:allantoate amidohydrolase [uncultured Microbacterium sp.]|uniref:Amidase, hydantoinase/carbamoylase family n=1 Tax=uncultured Microbacterium sp. TaxID=191216 RepID=A0A1Y5P720_9MICO|nr:allantoate amidohydrolase [uncultured Microbacterium sp.]SBS71728.1 Amidase, hydantoinase/carbamoylase family [uncultured Microbacterium sp.]
MSVVGGLLGELTDVGVSASGRGYDRQSWTAADLECRQWFLQCADALDLDVETDRNGNLWAWWRPDLPGTAFVMGSHLDSVPDGGAYDGPLGVASAFTAIATLRRDDFVPTRPMAVVAFADEEGARFGVACVGSRLMVGALSSERALGLKDSDGGSLADAMTRAGQPVRHVGHDAERVARIGEFVELHIEQGHLPARDGRAGLIAADAPVGVGAGIWPHGRWRVDFPGQQNHAGTTPLAARRDPMIGLAHVVLAVRRAAQTYGALATVGKVRVVPGAVNSIPGSASLWIDARAADERAVRRVLADVRRVTGFSPTEESWTADTAFDPGLTAAVAAHLGDVPVLPSGAGHDAGVLALAGIPTTMLLVRNPTGISHAPEERADDADCEHGVAALVATIRARVR